MSLLKNDPQIRVTVLEARELCSGATGRNGGQLAINAAETYEDSRARLGPDMALKIVHFTMQTLDRMRQMASDFNIADAEISNVNKVRAFLDRDLFEKAQKGIALLESDDPSLKGLYKIIDADACLKEHGIHDAIGGIMHPSGTVWPYRLVTGAWEKLMQLHPNRLTIETNTPVHLISEDPDESSAWHYTLETPRGNLKARHVSHNTNGYTSHLLPELRGPLFPLKGTMTVQDLSSILPNRGDEASWAIHYNPVADPETGDYADGLCYMAQSAKTGLFYFGGEKCPPTDMISGDDTFVSESSQKFLEETLLKFFGKHEKSEARTQSVWSGIMCFSCDGLPVCGRLPQSVTKRTGRGEWIAAAYGGYGMPNALLAGENLGNLILGKELDPGFPEAYLLTESRLTTTLSQNSVREFAANLGVESH
ncbi:hypothetical protein E8E14_001955 [Neopestalotiopsis sp. 37M]|nr:hypothetical protein E8E14_001955 [Neopestalotiopsis sp. 37M]